jgi:hypothetical protein
MILNPRVVATPATDVEFLASRQMITKPITLSRDTVAPDPEGDRILRAGTVLGEIAATPGIFGPYDDAALDGRAVARCILLNTINLRHGNAAAAAVTWGVVREARLIGLDAAGKADLTRFEFR